MRRLVLTLICLSLTIARSVRILESRSSEPPLHLDVLVDAPHSASLQTPVQRATDDLSTLTGSNLPDTTKILGVNFVAVSDTAETEVQQNTAAKAKATAPANPNAGANLIAVAGYDGASSTPTSEIQSTTTSAVTASSTDTSGVSSTDQKAWVDGHNVARKKYGNVPLLTWDDTLVPAAKTNADQCTGKHTVQRKYGENIADESGALPIKDAIDMWVNEAAYTDFETYETTKPGLEVGHFTQVVWKSSQRVGCWISTCAPGTVFGAQYGTSYQATCEYDPPGNVIGLSNYQANVFAA